MRASRRSACTKCGAWRGCLGLEPTIDRYIEHLVAVFREVRRVLRKDGTVWLNLGDSYTSGGRIGHGHRIGVKQQTNKGCLPLQHHRPPQPVNLKPKDLCGIPWRVVLALQSEGWWLRSDIVWQESNALPESVRDRVTRIHEYVFLLTKSARYFFDQEAVREPQDTLGRRHEGRSGGRDIRSVWTISTQPYREAHFATFPEKLVTPCVKAGAGEKGCCPKCGSPLEADPGAQEVRPRQQRRSRLGEAEPFRQGQVAHTGQAVVGPSDD